MDKKTKRNLSKGALLSAELKGHSITTTIHKSLEEWIEDKQENSFEPKVSEQNMSNVVVEGHANNQDSLDKHTESEEQESEE